MKWWYGDGWKKQLASIGSGVKNITSAFSVKILLSTMFNPWKQIVSRSFADTALEDKLKASLDNLVSRTIGFFVRSVTLFIAAIAVLVNLTVRTVILITWPLIPVLPIIFVLAALVELAS